MYKALSLFVLSNNSISQDHKTYQKFKKRSVNRMFTRKGIIITEFKYNSEKDPVST